MLAYAEFFDLLDTLLHFNYRVNCVPENDNSGITYLTIFDESNNILFEKNGISNVEDVVVTNTTLRNIITGTNK